MRIRVFQGEFGLKIRYHVPWVYSLGPGHEVEIEEGEEALYPRAGRWIIMPRAHDDTRVKGPKRYDRGERFVPKPYIEQNIAPADVILCPRKRTYGANKNWPYWDELRELLLRVGVTSFAAGAPDSSTDWEGRKAWDYPRFLDASIEAMLKARLVIATDAGLAHLAILCGRPLLLITYKGLVAPGPVIDSKGQVAFAKYWPVRLHEYYIKANHQKVPIEPIDGWESPEVVADNALRMLRSL